MARRIAILVLVTGILASATFASSDNPAADVAAPVKAAVNHFYDRIAKGKSSDNAELFLKPDVPINGFAVRRPDDRPFFQKSASDYLKSFLPEPRYFVVDRIDVTRIHDHLAVAAVEWKTGGARGHSVMTWSSDGQKWRIASMFVDQHFVW